MKIAVRYQSRGGNTKAVAEVIAKTAGVTAEPIDVPISEPVDLLFVGGGVYAWDIDKGLKSYLESLSPKIVKSVAAFTTAGGMDKTEKITSIVRAQGIIAREEALPIKLALRNHTTFVKNGQITLSAKELQSIEDFVKKMIV